MYFGTCTYGYIRTDPSLPRKRRKSAFHEQAEPAYYSYRESIFYISRSYLPYEYSSISLSPEPLLVALRFVLFLPCVLPFLSSLSLSLSFRIYIGAVERLRPQVRLYITEHVPARDMLHAVRFDLERWAKDAEGEPAVRIDVLQHQRGREKEKEHARVCVRTFLKRRTSHETFREREVIEFGKHDAFQRDTRDSNASRIFSQNFLALSEASQELLRWGL